MKTFRRPLLAPLRDVTGVAVRQQMQRDIRDLQRAPVRIPPTQVIVPVKKPTPMATPAGVDIFYPGYIYRIASDTWETLGNSGDEFLPGSPVAGIIGETLYRNPADFSLWRSGDRGAMWTPVLASGDFSIDGDSDLDLGVAPEGTWWALNDASPSKIYKSADADTWTESYVFSGTISGGDMGSLAVCPTDSNRIGALGFDGSSVYVVVSTDGGDTWGSEVAVSIDVRAGAVMAWFGDTHLCLLVDEPAAGDLVRQRIYVSDDDGATWTNAFENTSGLTLINADRLPYLKTYENGVLVFAVNNKAFRTADGSTFSTVTPPLGGGAGRIRGIVLVSGVLWTLTDDGGFYKSATAKASPPLAPTGFGTPLVQI